MIILSSMFIPFFIGILSVFFLVQKTTLPQKFFFSLSLAIPVGLSLISLILFISYLVFDGMGPIVTKAVSVAVFICLTALFVWRNYARSISWIMSFPDQLNLFLKKFRAKPLGTKILELLIALFAVSFFVMAFISYVEYFSSRTVWDVFGGWDARYFWNLRAKFYFRIPSAWDQMFLSQVSHPSYPSLLPGAVAWGWIWTGKEFLIWPAVVAFLFAASALLFTMWFFSISRSAWHGFFACTLLLSMDSFRFWSTTQYADIPLSFLILASGTLLMLFFKKGEYNFLIGAFFLAGLTAWMKDEGLFYCVEFLLIALVVALIKEKPKNALSLVKKWFLPLLLFSLPIAANFVIKLFLAQKGGDYWGAERDANNYLSFLFNTDRSKLIFMAYVFFLSQFSEWNIVWIAFILAPILNFRRVFSECRWIPFGLVVAIHLGYIFILHVTPHDLAFQIQTAFTRIVLHSTPLALLSVFLAFPPITNPSGQRIL